MRKKMRRKTKTTVREKMKTMTTRPTMATQRHQSACLAISSAWLSAKRVSSNMSQVVLVWG